MLPQVRSAADLSVLVLTLRTALPLDGLVPRAGVVVVARADGIGVDTPAPGSGYANTVPTLASLFGPLLPCSGPRGTARPGGHGDYAALGQLIADVTGSDYAPAGPPP